MSKSKRRALAPQIDRPAGVPADVRALLGAAPITGFEDAAGYERVLARMADAVAPRDFVEWMWLKDVVDLWWDAARLRRARAVRLALARREAIETILRADWPLRMETQNYYQFDQSIIRFADRAYRGAGTDFDEEGECFETRVARLGLGVDAVNDLACHIALDDLERLQRLLENADARRDAALREIERRREALGRRLREATAMVGPIIDAEFE